MTVPQILVRRQVLDVEVHGAEADGLALQHRLPALCADAVSPALEAVLAPLDAAGEHLVIDVLAVDVGEVPLDRLETALAEQLRRELDAYVRSHRARSSTGDAGERPQVVFRRRSDAESVDEAFLQFLRTGRLPWWVRVEPGIRFEDLVRDAWRGADPAGASPPPPTIRRVAALLADVRVRERLVAQFSPPFAVVLLRALSPDAAVAAGEAMTVLDPVLLPAAVRRRMARGVWDAALLAAVNRTPARPAEIVHRAWSGLEPADRWDEPLVALLEQSWPGLTRTVAESAEAPATVSAAGGEAHPPDVVDGVVAENAGLVLLHPFLPQFFDALGVAAGGELIDPDRALCLLHYLATGETVAPEHRLTLAKVLCGIPLDRPVAADVGLTADETAEAEALLEAVVSHWSALGHASPDALRGEFLARAGLLSVDAEDDWLLRVEARTLDILLDRLPWGISLVQTPWMPSPLTVEWR